jgi:hypothetical protein
MTCLKFKACCELSIYCIAWITIVFIYQFMICILNGEIVWISEIYMKRWYAMLVRLHRHWYGLVQGVAPLVPKRPEVLRRFAYASEQWSQHVIAFCYYFVILGGIPKLVLIQVSLEEQLWSWLLRRGSFDYLTCVINQTLVYAWNQLNEPALWYVYCYSTLSIFDLCRAHVSWTISIV